LGEGDPEPERAAARTRNGRERELNLERALISRGCESGAPVGLEHHGHTFKRTKPLLDGRADADGVTPC
jgi:hypothetical protein